MKYIFFILCCCLIQSCISSKSPENWDYLSVICDMTDSMKQVSNLTGQQIASQLPVTSGVSNRGCMLRFYQITDQRFNRVVTVSIPPVQPLSSNEIDRKKAVAAFRKQIDSCVAIIRQAKKGRPHSLVFSTLSSALNELEQQPNTTSGMRRLILLSDARENSAAFSCYTPGVDAIIKMHPDTIAKVMEKYYPVSELKGIEVIVVNQPSVTEDESYYFLTSALKDLFTSKSAKVSITTVLN